MNGKLVGSWVIVRSRVAGVHAGRVESFDPGAYTVTLVEARRLWRYYTRDESGSVSDVAANGLASGKDHQLGAKLPRVTIVAPDGLELAEMTEAAAKSVIEWNA